MKNFILVNNDSTRENNPEVKKILRGGVFMKKLMAALFILGAMGAYANETEPQHPGPGPDHEVSREVIHMGARLVKPLKIDFDKYINFGTILNTGGHGFEHVRPQHGYLTIEGTDGAEIEIKAKGLDHKDYAVLRHRDRRHEDAKLYVDFSLEKEGRHGDRKFDRHDLADGAKTRIDLDHRERDVRKMEFKLVKESRDAHRLPDGCYTGELTLEAAYTNLDCGSYCAS